MQRWFFVLSAALLLCSLVRIPQTGEMVPLRAAIERFRQALSTGEEQTVAELWEWDALFMPRGGEGIQERGRVGELRMMKCNGAPEEWKASQFVHVWKKQSDGLWKLHLGIWNASPSPT